MFRVLHRGKVVGMSNMESGDPTIGCVSGALFDSGDAQQLSEWIINEGGVQEEGVFLLEMNPEDFMIVFGPQTMVPFQQGSILSVPSEDEMFVEIVGIPEQEYAHFFPAHIAGIEVSDDSAKLD